MNIVNNAFLKTLSEVGKDASNFAIEAIIFFIRNVFDDKGFETI